ncbi:MAG TPA: phosphatidate cytidylyltransferase [Bradyrhizobium sp.]|nr:phosphatidate cytidylyltransferase [Bradyrhizobium sp.]
MTENEAAPAAIAVKDRRNLVMRIIAALVLAPAAILIAYLGGWIWAALVMLAAIGLYAEWLAIIGMTGRWQVMAAGIVALILIGWLIGQGRFEALLITLALGLVAVGALAPERRIWSAAGFLYAATAQIAAILMRMDPGHGLSALIVILFVVWATDIGGYIAGRSIGGPKLWPRVSPNKTWAGAIGGFAASLVVAAGFASLKFAGTGPLLTLGAVLSIAAQFGDLFESAVKRRFGVKDSGRIIPGHGGLWDRLDGFVAAIILAAIFGLLRGGVDGVGHGLMVW